MLHKYNRVNQDQYIIERKILVMNVMWPMETIFIKCIIRVIMLQVHDIYKAYSGTIMSPFASCLTHPEKSVQQGLYLV